MDGIWAGQEWTVAVAPFLAGLAIGALTAYLALRPDYLKRRQLQAEAERLNGELRTYREQVYQHFRRTSDLFEHLTASYRSVYEHLATGARALCSEDRLAPMLDLPEWRLLEGSEGVAGAAPSPGPAGGAGVGEGVSATLPASGQGRPL